MTKSKKFNSNRTIPILASVFLVSTILLLLLSAPIMKYNYTNNNKVYYSYYHHPSSSSSFLSYLFSLSSSSRSYSLFPKAYAQLDEGGGFDDGGGGSTPDYGPPDNAPDYGPPDNAPEYSAPEPPESAPAPEPPAPVESPPPPIVESPPSNSVEAPPATLSGPPANSVETNPITNPAETNHMATTPSTDTASNPSDSADNSGNSNTAPTMTFPPITIEGQAPPSSSSSSSSPLSSSSPGSAGPLDAKTLGITGPCEVCSTPVINSGNSNTAPTMTFPPITIEGQVPPAPTMTFPPIDIQGQVPPSSSSSSSSSPDFVTGAQNNPSGLPDDLNNILSTPQATTMPSGGTCDKDMSCTLAAQYLSTPQATTDTGTGTCDKDMSCTLAAQYMGTDRPDIASVEQTGEQSQINSGACSPTETCIRADNGEPTLPPDPMLLSDNQLERMNQDLQNINSPLGALGYLICGMDCAKLGTQSLQPFISVGLPAQPTESLPTVDETPGISDVPGSDHTEVDPIPVVPETSATPETATQAAVDIENAQGFQEKTTYEPVQPYDNYNLAHGNVGEKLAAESMAADGHDIIMYKPDVEGTSANGIDMVTMKDGTVYLVDNKAYTSTDNIGKVSSLTGDTFQKNLDDVKTNLQDLISDPTQPAETHEKAQEALDAINSGNYQLVVTNANVAKDTQVPPDVTQSLKNQGIQFIDLFHPKK
jgi:hypothetical protein